MQSLLEFSANKSCPELSPDCSLLSDLLLDNTELYNSLQRSHSYPLFSESELDSSIHDLHEVKVTAVQDDIIEILSCRVIQEEDVPSRSALLPLKGEYWFNIRSVRANEQVPSVLDIRRSYVHKKPAQRNRCY